MLEKLRKSTRIIYESFDLFLLSLIAFILLLPKFPLIGVEGIYVNIRLEDFVITFVFGLWVGGVMLGYFDLAQIFSFRPLVFFLVWGLFITCMGIFVMGTVDKVHLGLLHYLRRVEYIMMYFVAATTLKQRKFRDYVYFVVGIAFFAWLYGILQWKNILPGVSTLSRSGKLGTYEELSYVISTFAAHYDFGAFLMLTSLITLGLFFSFKDWKKKIPCIFFVFMLWWMAKLVYARIAYVALVLMLTLFLIIKRNIFSLLPLYELIQIFDRYIGGKFSRYSYKFSLKILPESAKEPTPIPKPTVFLEAKKGTRDVIQDLVSSSKTTGVKSWWDKVSFRLQSLLSRLDINLDPSANIRIQEWQDRMAKVGWRFLWGLGYGSIGIGADNDYIRAICEVGILGLSLFILILKDFFFLLLKGYREAEELFSKNFYLALCLGIVGLLINALFIDIFEASKIAFFFWFLMGMACSNFKVQSSKFKSTI